jgi:phage-related protein
MSDFTLSRQSIEESLSYNVLKSQFENGVEQRRLKGSNPIQRFTIESPELTKTQAKAYRDFLISKFGELTSFTFTSPIDDTEYNVRFDGDIRIRLETGTYKVYFAFQVLW